MTDLHRFLLSPFITPRLCQAPRLQRRSIALIQHYVRLGFCAWQMQSPKALATMFPDRMTRVYAVATWRKQDCTTATFWITQTSTRIRT